MTALEGKALLDHGRAIARRYARRVGGDVAEELRAEAVLRALGSPPPDGRMEPWLERIYRNLLVDRWRRGKVATIHADVERFATAHTPEDDLLGHERRRAVRESLRQLPRETRRALLSRYYGELDDGVAAARLGIAPATVRTRIHRALARLRTRLGDVRAWCPPIDFRVLRVLDKLGTQTASVGLAPVLVAVFVVAGAVPPPPEAIPEALTVLAETQPPAQVSAQSAAMMPPDRPTPTPASSPPQVAKRALTVTPTVAPIVAPTVAPTVAASPPPTTAITLASEEPIVGEILHPDTIDIFAEPERPTPPCLVEAPPSFLAQVDKMMDDLL